MYVLDTNICIYIIKKKRARLFDRLERCRIGQVGISSITLAELQFGVEKSIHRDQNREALLRFLAPLEVLVFDSAAACAYGTVRAQLESRGKRIGPLDELIAAHALSLKATLVTNNVREFKRVAGLDVEDWSR